VPYSYGTWVAPSLGYTLLSPQVDMII